MKRRRKRRREGWKEEEKEGGKRRRSIGRGERGWKEKERNSIQPVATNARIKLAAQAESRFCQTFCYELRKRRHRSLPLSLAGAEVKSRIGAEQLATFQTFPDVQPTGEDRLSPGPAHSRNPESALCKPPNWPLPSPTGWEATAPLKKPSSSWLEREELRQLEIWARRPRSRPPPPRSSCASLTKGVGGGPEGELQACALPSLLWPDQGGNESSSLLVMSWCSAPVSGLHCWQG